MNEGQARVLSLSQTPAGRFITCPACGGNDLTYAIRFEERRLDVCNQCQLVFFNPQPSHEELPNIGVDEKDAINVPSSDRELAQDLVRMLKAYSGMTDPVSMRLLQVICEADHSFSETDFPGFDVSTYNISKQTFESTDGRELDDVCDGSVADSTQAAADSFDVCILVDVLDRVCDPVALLRKMRQFLRPEGIILIAGPSLRRWSYRLSRAQTMGFNLDQLFYFNPSNLHTVLYRSGFDSIQTLSFRKPIESKSAQNKIESTFGARLFRWWSTLTSWNSFIKRGNYVVCIARCSQNEPSVMKKLSVIVPAYNESETFSLLAQDLVDRCIGGMDLEIIFVESNSSDGTREQVLTYKDNPRVKIVLQDAPRGKGNAVREGFRHATGDIILIQDADLEYDLWDYDALIRPIVELRRSFVLGLRHHGSALKMRRFVDQHFLAVFINFGHKILTSMFNILFHQSLRDPWTMFKVFRRDCISGIDFACNHFDFDIELVIKLVRRGFEPVEIPVNYASRSFSEGKKVSIFRDPIRIVSAMLRLWGESRSDSY